MSFAAYTTNEKVGCGKEMAEDRLCEGFMFFVGIEIEECDDRRTIRDDSSGSVLG